MFHPVTAGSATVCFVRMGAVHVSQKSMLIPTTWNTTCSSCSFLQASHVVFKRGHHLQQVSRTRITRTHPHQGKKFAVCMALLTFILPS